MDKRVNILVDFGGPRSLDEIESFLIELLTDKDVVRNNLWSPLHRYLFKRVAKKRVLKVLPDYQKIGGKSPLYENTELLKEKLQSLLNEETLVFHRYLPQTHPTFFSSVQRFTSFRVVPLFPQFTYATTGSCAKFFARHLPDHLVQKMRWLKSYPAHPLFVRSWVSLIAPYLEKDAFLLFTFHGVPEKFIHSGDLYLDECLTSYRAVMAFFPEYSSLYAFQSQFGPDTWIQPSTQEVCEKIERWAKPHQKIVVIPLSFTSDHIETLYEIDQIYLPILKANHYEAVRVPALNQTPLWIETLHQLFLSQDWCNTQMLIRPKGCRTRCACCPKRCTS